MTLLVKENDIKTKEVRETIALWQGNAESYDEDILDQWVESGVAFYNSSEGIRSIYKSEKKMNKNIKRLVKPSRRNFMAADVYKNIGTEEDPIYLKSSLSSQAERIKNSLGIEKDRKKFLHDLIAEGKIFTNVTKLFTEETLRQRADSISIKLKNEYPMTSKEWEKWTEATSRYNATSLTQVIAEYFSKQSIGDIGGEHVNYVPRRGYPGTLAPGELFKEDCPFEELGNKVLHPWPAMQQFQFHVRWPPAHPMIPPPLLWIGLCNKYTESFTNSQLSLPLNETVGGLAMEPADAIRIAKFAKFGNAYEPSEQLQHGGSLFKNGYNIPFYNPDHGPTVPEEDAQPPIPDELRPVTETWLDPYFGLETNFVSTPPEKSDTSESDYMDEEEARKSAIEKMWGDSPPSWRVQEEELEKQIESEIKAKMASESDGSDKSGGDDDDMELGSDTVAGYLSMNVNAPEEFASGERGSINNLLADDTLQNRRKAMRKQINSARQLQETSDGKARGRKTLIKYTIETIQDMQSEILNAERDLAMIRKAAKKTRRKATRTPDDLDDNADIMVENYDDEGGTTSSESSESTF